MLIITRGHSKIYRCPSHKANELSLKHGGTFSENSKLSFQVFIKVSYSWSTERPILRAKEGFSLDKKAIIKWYQYLRDLYSQYLVNNEYQIGGINKVTQIV